MNENNIINMSDEAVIKLKDIIAEENNPQLKLRIFVSGGGCSGFRYGFELTETQNPDDTIIPVKDINLLVDEMSYIYLAGATINFKEDQFGSEFTIENPNATTTCGCGSSFSV